MAITDSLNGSVYTKLDFALTRAQTLGGMAGKDNIIVSANQDFADGTAADQASCWLTSSFSATTGGVTISLADSADPLGAAGDDVPSADPEGLKLRAIFVANDSTTNYVELGVGTNAVTSWIEGTTPTVRIPAGGFFVQTFPSGLDALNDGVDDEIKITADTASCTCRITVIYG